jgi:mono/diheme cytochrome c family protein
VASDLWPVACGASLAIATGVLAIGANASRGDPPPTHSDTGASSYAEFCAECHGATLGGGKGPPLRGAAFLQNWRQKTARDLYSRILSTMPASAPGTLPDETALDVSIYVLTQNGVDVGSQAKRSPDALSTIEINP